MQRGQDHNNTNMSHFDSPQTTETSPSGGDVLLKWGHRKRSRITRASIEDSSSSVHPKSKKISHTVPAPLAAKLSSASMLPPPPLSLVSSTASDDRGRKDRPRNLEDPSVPGSESPSRNSQCCNPFLSRFATPKVSSFGMERSNTRMPSSGSAKCQKPSGALTTTQTSERLNSHGDSGSVQSEQGEKVTVEEIEWPRIYIALSRKEKEDDFLAMKGTKIPQRPKKRAKNIDRTLQYCFPGMWLSELTKSRYEVREKKSVKKQKHRGLKGMECLESDLE